MVLTDVQWERLAPLIEAVRPRGKTRLHDLRRTIEAILWRHDNGTKWRAIPAELGPLGRLRRPSLRGIASRWWMAAQTFIRWARLGVWERLLNLAQEHAGGVDLGMAFLDGTNIRAHAKAAGAAKKILWGDGQLSAGRLGSGHLDQEAPHERDIFYAVAC